MNRRFLSVRLPFFPVERFLSGQSRNQHPFAPWEDERSHKPQDAPRSGSLVLVRHGAKGTRITAVSREALSDGLWVGMKLNDARAMMPDLRAEHHDIEADRHARGVLGRRLMRYSPAVALYGPDGFLLDTAGCDHLFGGEQAMAEDMAMRLGTAEFYARLAFADTVGAALALTSHGADRVHILPESHASRYPSMLDSLPVEALRLDEDSVVLLRRLGLKRIGDVRSIPRTALERRFRERDPARRKKGANPAAVSQSVQWRLDQLNGIVGEPLDPICEPHLFRVARRCPDLAIDPAAVGVAMQGLLPDLCQMLARQGVGARHFHLTGYRADGGSSAVDVHLSQPARDAVTTGRLFRDKLDHIDCGYGIDLFVLSASGIAPVADDQRDMMGASAPSHVSASLGAFADVVNNRVGAPAVSKLAPLASHVPERAQISVPVGQRVQWREWETTQPVWSPRPLRLFTRPEPCKVTAGMPDSPPAQFVWRRVLRRVIRARGPERILPEWWHDDLKARRSALFRDYYDVEDSEGLRYWIFRSIRQEPVVAERSAAIMAIADQDGVEAPPQPELMPEFVIVTRWFVHGLF